jgi:hypothetical protein
VREILKDGQFKIVSRSKGLVKAEPWSQYTSPDKGCDWVGRRGRTRKEREGDENEQRAASSRAARWRRRAVAML